MCQFRTCAFEGITDLVNSATVVGQSGIETSGHQSCVPAGMSGSECEQLEKVSLTVCKETETFARRLGPDGQVPRR